MLHAVTDAVKSAAASAGDAVASVVKPGGAADAARSDQDRQPPAADDSAPEFSTTTKTAAAGPGGKVQVVTTTQDDVPVPDGTLTAAAREAAGGDDAAAAASAATDAAPAQADDSQQQSASKPKSKPARAAATPALPAVATPNEVQWQAPPRTHFNHPGGPTYAAGAAAPPKTRHSWVKDPHAWAPDAAGVLHPPRCARGSRGRGAGVRCKPFHSTQPATQCTLARCMRARGVAHTGGHHLQLARRALPVRLCAACIAVLQHFQLEAHAHAHVGVWMCAHQPTSAPCAPPDRHTPHTHTCARVYIHKKKPLMV
jgi:hypothetical protein